MKILMISKYPPIEGGVSVDSYWTAQALVEFGHDVHVLTNASEVESQYRVKFTHEDEKLLTGYNNHGSITIHSTYMDKHHVFIPQNNPSVSKLCGLGIEICKKIKPDLIWAYYIEPYGVVSLLLSKLTGIPYVFRHAGSDIGRLMPTKQLKAFYEEVLKNASLIMTRTEHFDRFCSLGVAKERLVSAVSVKLPQFLFNDRMPLPRNSTFLLGVYGKTGETKGSGKIIEAIELLEKENYPCKLTAHWGGREIETYQKMISKKSLSGRVELKEYIPHWHIPKFIQGCHAILFLENRFRISFHGPYIPLESLSCGRLLITTREIQKKHSYDQFLLEGRNCVIIELPITPEKIVEAIKKAQKIIDAGLFKSDFDSKKFSEDAHISFKKLLNQIEFEIKTKPILTHAGFETDH